MSYPESFWKPISLEKAIRICIENSVPIEDDESIPLEEALARVLAEDVTAGIDVPSFARSAMDGYAVRSVDVQSASPKHPVALRIKSSVFAGDPTRISISRGECVSIATGGMLPKGADAVVMVEHTKADMTREGSVQVLQPVSKGEHVILPGSDIRRGSVVVRKGDRLSPAKIGALSAIGRSAVRVYRRPRIVVMPTGNEVVRPGMKLKSGQIYDVNTFTIFSAASSFGADARIARIVEDDEESISKAISSQTDADIIVLSGGSSVGEKDLLAKVIEKEGEILFHGVAIKPGKPTLLGRIGRTLVLGMPGHPTSCLSNAYLFLRPMVLRMGRMPDSPTWELKLRLSANVRLPKDRKLILPVRVKGELAVPTFKESSAITSMVDADGFAVLPPSGSMARKGMSIVVRLY